MIVKYFTPATVISIFFFSCLTHTHTLTRKHTSVLVWLKYFHIFISLCCVTDVYIAGKVVVIIFSCFYKPLREKCPNTKFLLVRIQSKTSKYGPEKTGHLDTFHTVNIAPDCFKLYIYIYIYIYTYIEICIYIYIYIYIHT